MTYQKFSNCYLLFKRYNMNDHQQDDFMGNDDAGYGDQANQNPDQINNEQQAAEEETACRYTKLEKIGIGTYGKVFKVLDNETQQVFAMKQIKLHNAKEGITGLTMREISLLKSFNHENIVKLHDLILQPERICLIFEFMKFSVRDFIEQLYNKHYLSDHRFVKVAMHRLLSGIAYIHSKRVMHRDLKPDNIMLSSQGDQLKIIDFGFARKKAAHNEKYTIEACTLWYRAPEILEQTGVYSTPSDIWSAGCIFAELLSLSPLFNGDSEVQQVH